MSQVLSRRQLLAAFTGLSRTVLLSGWNITRGARNRSSWLPGLQLYTLGDAPRMDLDGTLQQVAAIGYRAVELPGHYGHSAQEPRRGMNRQRRRC